jgi:hypothetical protein
MQVLQFFFDRPEVISRLDRATLKALSKAGAFTRTRARSLLRRRKRASKAGEAPSVHSRDQFVTLRNILFAFDGVDSVIIGPVGLNQRFASAQDSQEVDEFTEQAEIRFGDRRAPGAGRRPARLGGKTVPQILEEGGEILVPEKLIGNKWFPIGRRKARPGQPVRMRRARIERRPWMSRALWLEKPKFPELWARSIQ